MTRHDLNIAFIAFGILMQTVSCIPEKNYTTEINRLDSLQVALNSQVRDVAASASVNTDSVANHLKFIQSSYVGAINESNAKILEQYSLCEKSVHSWNNLKDSIIERSDMLNLCISNLKKALTEKATHDAKGNEMTEEYITRSIISESEKVKLLNDQMNTWISGYKNIQTDFARIEPQVRQMVDSLTLSKR